MRISTRMRAAAAAFAVVAGSLTFTAATAGTANASGCPSGGQVLGSVLPITTGSQQVGQFYLGWNCNGAYTEVNIWNTNIVNNWSYGQVDVVSSSNSSANNSAPVYNNGSYWFDAGYIPVYVTNNRLYHGSFNFTANGYNCSGSTSQWNFANGSYTNNYNGITAGAHCS